MSRYFISLCILWSCALGQAQTDSLETKPKDEVVHKQKYGLRFGIDLSRPLLSMFEDDYTGLEFVGDYRLTQKLFLAAELGNEKKIVQEDLYNFTTSGSYIKAGVDYNTYANWYGEQNSIHVGGRYAFGTFNHTLNDYQVYSSNRYWNGADFADGIGQAPREFGGLNAHWLEAVLGVKAELFANIYFGASVRIGILISRKGPENFQNLFIPGFNRVTDGSSFGVGYNYTLTYFLPLYKKVKKSKKESAPE